MKAYKSIKTGDRIYARLTMGGRTIVEFMMNTIADMTQLLSELRHMTAGLHGLTKLYVRNQSQGWSMERPLMLYDAPKMWGNDYPQTKGLEAALRPAAPQRMAFPWETH